MEAKIKVNHFLGGVRYRRVPGGATVIPDRYVNDLASDSVVVVPPAGMYYDEDAKKWLPTEDEIPEVAEDALAARETFQAQLKAEKDQEALDAAEASKKALNEAAAAENGSAALDAQGKAAKSKK